MTVSVDMQVVSEQAGIPDVGKFQRWIDAAVGTRREQAEVVVRIVDEAESTQLNEAYRNKQGPTNVLSFPFEAPEQVKMDLLGDLVICAPVISREAQEQGKTEDSHWAHMAVHGSLHLLGFDHQTDEQAREMEGLERDILVAMGYEPPYRIEEEQITMKEENVS